MLTDDRIDELSREMVKGYKSVNWLAYTIATEIRNEDEALIRQMLEALTAPCAGEELLALKQAAITAARDRLEKAP